MSYEPTTWKDGDLVTSAKLNKLEQGVANGGSNEMVLLHVTDNGDGTSTYTLDKTWQEIWDNNYTVACVETSSRKDFCQIDAIDAQDYTVHLLSEMLDVSGWLEATSADGYPTAAFYQGGSVA